MDRRSRKLTPKISAGAAISCAVLVGALGGAPNAQAATPSATYIVGAGAGLGATNLVTDIAEVGGSILQSLSAANAVEATLTASEVALLQAIPSITVTPNLAISLASATTTLTSSPAEVFAEQSGATKLWAAGDTGTGVNVAVLDTGITALPDFGNRLLPGVDLSGGGNPTDDAYGHGTFVAGLIAGDGSSSDGQYTGEAPSAGLVPVKVAGASGNTDLATVIAGIGWVISHRVSDNIRVLNLSLGYQPIESTLVDPLDQAVQLAWNDGIVVVVAAGNDGPFNGTILSPGDDPSVITVGALDDHGSATGSGNTMATFSSVGPTEPDGWFKPDLVASGQSVISLRDPGSTVDVANPSARIGSANFVGSGTSFSTAIVSGAAALVLADHPGDSPNEVKAALLGTTNPGPVGNPFVDGHGALDVAAAAGSTDLNLSQTSGAAPVANAVGSLLSTLGVTKPSAVQLETTWSASNWNPANWQGLTTNPVPSTKPLASGSAWSGSAWSGSAWSGSAWSGSAWSGSAWSGSAWSGSAWSGSAWSGSAWSGSAWSGSAWSGSAWS